MASTARQTPDPIGEGLSTQDARHYQFYQLLRQLELQQAAQTQPDFFAHLNISTNASLAFPATDIESLIHTQAGDYQLLVNFMGLLGVDSPLPLYFQGLSQQDTQDAVALRAFLSIFFQRFYQLLYLGWKKMHPLLFCKRDPARQAFLYTADALSGRSLDREDFCLFALQPYFISRQRSALGLQAMLSNYLACFVSIEQYVQSWCDVDACHLSNTTSLCLGENTVLGNKVLTTTKQIKIVVHLQKFAQARQLLLDCKQQKKLHKLIRAYVGVTSSWRVILKIENFKPPEFILGNDNNYLAWNTRLGSLKNETISVECQLNRYIGI